MKRYKKTKTTKPKYMLLINNTVLTSYLHSHLSHKYHSEDVVRHFKKHPLLSNKYINNKMSFKMATNAPLPLETSKNSSFTFLSHPMTFYSIYLTYCEHISHVLLSFLNLIQGQFVLNF